MTDRLRYHVHLVSNGDRHHHTSTLDKAAADKAAAEVQVIIDRYGIDARVVITDNKEDQ